MNNVKRLPTGVYVVSYKTSDGTTRFKVLTQRQFNLQYKMNVWWTKTKDYLKSNNISTYVANEKND